MIDITKAVEEFKKYIAPFEKDEEAAFDLKETHTYGVMRISKMIAESLELSDEDIKLAELIGLLHDIGRFEEMRVVNSFDSGMFDHAAYGVKILFEDGLITRFTDDEELYPIIKAAVGNHSKLAIEDGLNERELLHAKIIRDSDKIDNFEVKINRKPEHLFKNTVNSRAEFENSLISKEVYDAIMNNKCVKSSDRKYALDYYIGVIGFILDINFKCSYKYIQEKDYISRLVDRFQYLVPETKIQMESIRKSITKWVEEHI